jgi:hypothetical protein
VNAEVAIRFALAIAFDALAFVVWDVGTRAPVNLVRDIVAGFRRPTALVRGVVRFLAGAALLVLAFVVARPGFPTSRSFMVIQTGMLIAALIVENLIGPDLRRRARRAA